MNKFLSMAIISGSLIGGMVSCGTPTPPTVGIVNPVDAFTKGTINIQVDVTGTPDSVELLKDGVLLAKLVAPFTYAWDTTSESEKKYSLTARAKKAGTPDVVSTAKQVTVDRTAPTVVTRLPIDEMTNVFLGDEISVTFNEPILASSVNATNVQLKIGANVVSSSASLNAAGTKVIIVPTVLPTLIATFNMVLNGITDKAGNLAVVADSNFTAPTWNSLGETLDNNVSKNAFSASITVDSSGRPIVAWIEKGDTTHHLFVKKWNGTTWTSLGGMVDFIDNINAESPSITVDSNGSPIVAWHQFDGTSVNIYVRKWNGTTWTSLGGIVDFNPSKNASEPSITIDLSGNPIVTWFEHDDTSVNIYVKKWDGTTWVLLGGIVDVNTSKNAIRPSITVDSSGKPIVTWVEYDGTSDNIYVKRWDGTTWVLLGGALDLNIGKFTDTPSITVDSSGNPIVTWAENDGGTLISNIYVKKWNGTTWDSLGGTLVFNDKENTDRPSITVDLSGNPIVAWHEQGNGSYNVYVKKWNGTIWNSLGGTLDFDASSDAASPSIIADSSGNPIVAWHELDSTSFGIYVKKLNRIP